MKQLLIIAALLVSASVCHAESAFTFQDGFYVKDGWAYTRTASTQRYLNSRKCWCTKTTYYYKKHHELKPVVVAPVVAPEPKKDYGDRYDWRPEMVKLANQIQEWEYKLDLQAQDDAAFVEWANALGLNQGYPQQAAQLAQNGTPSDYGLSARFQSTSTPYAQQGNTLYTYNAFAQRFSDVDNQLLFNQANEHAKNSLDLGREVTSNFSALMAQQLDGSLQLDKAEARRVEKERLVALIGEILKDPPVSTTNSAEINVTPQAPQPAQPIAPVPVNPDTSPTGAGLNQGEWGTLLNIVDNRCIECHSGDKIEGGIDLSNYRALSKNDKRQVVNSLRGEGKSGKVMPLNSEPLSDGEILIFIRDYLTTQGE